MLWEDNNYLVHFGIIGQRWGIRRFQNKDGSLTEEGKKRYGESPYRSDAEKGIFSRIKKNAEAMVYPPEMRGKSKEEKKAWEEAEKKKFVEESAKEQKTYEFTKKIDKFDKLDRHEQDDTIDKVSSEIKELEAKEKKDGGLIYEDRKMLDGLKDFYQTKGNEVGKRRAEEDLNNLEKMNGPEEKSKRMEELLQKAADALGPYADSTYPGYDDDGDPVSQSYNIKLCAELDKKIKGICDPLGLLGKGTSGNTPGTKAITDRMDKILEQQDKLWEEANAKAEKKGINPRTPKGFFKTHDIYNQMGGLALKKEYNDIELNELRAQICKEIGIPATSKNMGLIYPFIYYDPFYS